MNLLFWRKRKTKEKSKKKKRRLQQATIRQHIASDSQHEANMSALYKQLNELTLLLSKHDLFLRDDHHKKGLVALSRFLSENFYKLPASQQARIRQNVEFIETDKNILATLANSRRLRVVEILSVLRGRNITNRQYVSERVNRLVEAGFLERKRIGKMVYYSKMNREPFRADTSGDK